MINYIGINYLDNQFKVDMKNLVVYRYNKINVNWEEIPYKDITTFSSKFNSSNTLDFLYNTYTFRIEVSTIGLAVSVILRDNSTGRLYILPESNFNFSSSSLEDLFTINNELCILSSNIFYSITNDMIDNLSDERKTFFIRYCINSIKSNDNSSEFYNKFCNTLSEIVFRTNPELENNFISGE